MYSNGRAALLSALLAAVFLPVVLLASGLVDYAGELDQTFETDCGAAFVPREATLYSSFSSSVIFVIVLFWWQRIRSVLLKPHAVFLDKLCINQTDEEAKALGILGLAAFMKASEHFVVLWSPRYFTRLWCTYELAAWVKLGRAFGETVHIVPVTGSFRLFLLLTVSMLGTLLHDAFWMYDVSTTATIFVSTVWLPAGSFIAIHALRQLHGEVNDMARGLRTFSIDKAACFCCSHAHRHPQNGQRLPCDRDLVLRTLTAWLDGDTSASANMEGERASVHFNMFVQQNLGAVLFALKARLSSFGLAFLMSLSLHFLAISHSTGQLAVLLSGRLGAGFSVCGVMRFQFNWICYSLHLILLSKLLMVVARRTPISPDAAFTKAALGLSALICVASVFLAGLSYLVLREMTQWLPAGILLLCLAGVLVVLLASFQCFRRGTTISKQNLEDSHFPDGQAADAESATPSIASL
eukprot:TRINITY_DN9233_c0_g2_i2.p1 TRINITY_DN9233_c0_g2~~TRINITY_DN9233_c0_g2_i2.p1  ORF type:complete len:467 (-),score=42.02 TRINITY_DN9233_c0_g2_i2:133-1533(-)